MIRGNRKRGWAWILTGVLLVSISGVFHAPLIQRRNLEVPQAVPPEDTTPLVMITTVAFGGFRGLIADALWIRSARLQEDGQFFEMVQLANWITQLEPRAPKVWSFQAWNLAYNISVLFPEFEDRWRWILHGVNLLKQEGLTHNPASASLHWDIGWIYQHKIGMEFDQGHLYYKNRLAEEMESVFPDGRFPGTALTADQQEALTRQWTMSPSRMAKLEQRFGPLDWRLPEAHSLYWATKGLETPGTPSDLRSLERMQRQSLLTMIRAGQLVRDPGSGYAVTLPRPELIPLLEPLYLEVWTSNPEQESALAAYQNLLLEACVVYTETGQLPLALETYNRLASTDPNIAPGREAFQRFLQEVLSQPPSELTRTQAMSRVVTLLLNAQDPGLSQVRANGQLRMARQTHRLYQNSRENPEHLERTGLPPFEVMQGLLSSPGLLPGF